MICKKCGSSNVQAQVVNEVQLKKQHHGVFWWLFVGWWWVPIKWIFFTLPALIVKLCRRRVKAVNRQKTVFMCQNCGHRWDA